MQIMLKSNTLIIKKVISKTKAKMFKGLKEGDKILISIPVDYAGGGYRGTHASYMKVTNLRNNEYTHKSFNELPSLLGNFELAQEA